ncbi:tetratricopeptide repeat protein [Sphingomonas sp. CJ20]
MTEQRDRSASAFSQGLAYGSAGQHDRARDCFEEAVRHNANDAAARFNLALALRNLGRKPEAAETLRTILDHLPDQPDVLFCLAELLREMACYAEALTHLSRLKKVAPRHGGLDEALGLALLRTEAPEQAESPLRRAIVQNPACAPVLNNLGAAFMAQRRPADAERLYRRAAVIDEATPAYRKNLGVSQLLQGKLVAGFRNYEVRREQKIWGWNRDFSGKPEWCGDSIDGRTILVYFEQGLGDSVQFARYFPVLKAMGAQTIFLCQPELATLLARVPGIDRLIAVGDPLPDFDCHTSLMSLPNRLGTTVATIPGGIPYLSAAPDLARWWARRMPGEGLRVGIHWQARGPERSIPTAALAPLAAIPDVRLYSLQPEAGAERALLGEMGIVVREEIAPERTSFEDTAGMLANLDLAVCCDSSVAHIAGAMGVPVLMILPWLGDWRWMMDRDATPWYPRTRLFRSPSRGDWDAPIRAAASAIAAAGR